MIVVEIINNGDLLQTDIFLPKTKVLSIWVFLISIFDVNMQGVFYIYVKFYIFVRWKEERLWS